MSDKKEKETILFVLDEAPTFEWPVRVSQPASGKYVVAEFTGIFANLVGPEFEALTSVDESGTPKNTDRDIANQVLLGWGTDLKDPQGAPLAFTPENKARLLGNQRARLAVVGTFFSAARGMAAEKN